MDDREVNQNTALENRYAYDANSQYDNQNMWAAGRYTGEVNEGKKKKKKTNGKTVVACLLMCIAFTICNIGALLYVVNEYLPVKYMQKSSFKVSSTLDNENTAGKLTEGSSDGKYTISQIAELALPSVVAITSTSYIYQGINPFSQGYKYPVTGAGSGIIIGQNDKELLIVTNDHVVEDTTELSVEFVNGKSYSAYVKGTKSDCDIAVVAVLKDNIDTETLATIKIATLGDSDTVTVGEEVVAIGNALGYGQSVTNGIVSALDREVTTSTYTMKMIQTNAAINGGNSGGALINMKGEIIGINAAKTSSSSSTSSASVEGMGYAIPISDVKDVITNIMNSETKVPVSQDEKGYIGVSVMDITSYDAQLFNVKAGVKIIKVYESSGANDAGLYAGDIITKVNGEDISTNQEMADKLQYYKAGEKVKLTVMANMGKGQYEEKEVEVVLKTYTEIYGETNKN